MYYGESEDDADLDDVPMANDEDEDGKVALSSIKIKLEKDDDNELKTGVVISSTPTKLKVKLVLRKRSVAKKRTGKHTKDVPKTALQRLDSGIADLDDEEPIVTETSFMDMAMDLSIKKEVDDVYPGEAVTSFSSLGSISPVSPGSKVIGQIMASPTKSPPTKVSPKSPATAKTSPQTPVSSKKKVKGSVSSQPSVTDVIASHFKNVSQAGKNSVLLNIPNITVKKSLTKSPKAASPKKAVTDITSPINASPIKSSPIANVVITSPKPVSPRGRKTQPTARKKTGKMVPPPNIVPDKTSSSEPVYAAMVITDNAITGEEEPLHNLPPGDSTQVLTPEGTSRKISQHDGGVIPVVTTVTDSSHENTSQVRNQPEACVGAQDPSTPHGNHPPMHISNVQSISIAPPANVNEERMKETDAIVIAEDVGNEASNQSSSASDDSCVLVTTSETKPAGDQNKRSDTLSLQKDSREYNSLRDLACFYLSK
jgi:hypothetical protein